MDAGWVHCDHVAGGRPECWDPDNQGFLLSEPRIDCPGLLDIWHEAYAPVLPSCTDWDDLWVGATLLRFSLLAAPHVLDFCYKTCALLGEAADRSQVYPRMPAFNHGYIRNFFNIRRRLRHPAHISGSDFPENRDRRHRQF